MKFENPYQIPVVKSFLRLYSGTIDEIARDRDHRIVFLPLPDHENRYNDIIVRYRDAIYISETEINKLGLSAPEIFAALAHEIGHIVYGMLPFGTDAEMRADEFAAEVGLASQMIAVIEKIIMSRRFSDITSSLVQRIQFLHHLEQENQYQECYY